MSMKSKALKRFLMMKSKGFKRFLTMKSVYTCPNRYQNAKPQANTLFCQINLWHRGYPIGVVVGQICVYLPKPESRRRAAEQDMQLR